MCSVKAIKRRAKHNSEYVTRAVFHFRVTDADAELIRDAIPDGLTASEFLRDMVITGIKKGNRHERHKNKRSA